MTPPLRTPIGAQDHTLGPPDAGVQLVEYGDYECPACGRAFPEVEEVLRALSGRLLFAFRHFPISQLHPHATLAAEAAEAAGAQGRFWEMHRLLYTRQDALELPQLLTYAGSLDLDLVRFTADLEGHRFRSAIRRSFLAGARTGVNGTPTFFVHGHRHDGAFDAGSLREAIEGGRVAPGA